jgi:hypothetical protein
MSVKYAIPNRIDASNWVPTTHSSDIATWLGLISSEGRLLERMLKHLICLTLFFLLKFSCSMSCTVVVYTPEGFMLAYFVAKKGEKNGIFILSICLCLCYYVLFCIYFADLPVFSGVAFILQLFQVVCRC